MWAYAFPPLPLLPQLLQKIWEENTEVILVAPWWLTKVRSLELLELSVEPLRETVTRVKVRTIEVYYVISQI